MLYLDAALLFLILAFLRQHGSLAHRHTMISDTALNRKSNRICCFLVYAPVLSFSAADNFLLANSAQTRDA
jgi:hypothetical protein